MISYNWRISEEVTLRRSFAIEGAPWEFNLRDVIRWCKLLQRDDQSLHPVEHLRTIYLQRLRTQADRDRALALFGLAFGSQKPDAARPRWSLAPGHFQIGHALLPRENFSPASRSPIILPAQLRPLEAMSSCLMHSWLIILTGARDSGKTALVKLLSTLTGNYLHEVAVNNATDISDILGSFEQEDHMVHARTIADRLLQLVSSVLRTARGAATLTDGSLHSSIESLRRASSLQSLTTALRSVAEVLDVVVDLGLDKISQEASTARKAMDDFFRAERRSGRFVWVDGPLVQAMKSGHWVLLDGANLCNPSVLDRLNSLCEPQGVLTLNEKGQVNGEVEIIVPHPNFRLFMTVDPQHGELSRAMRNRGIEI
ncbi:P-loop containing nucleoside triphosphate hydrolase protein, partial [Gloeophyllum trabeum ATCC 11539]